MRFTSIISEPITVPVAGTRTTAHFHPSPEGGVFNGRKDENEDGPGGFTYGYIHQDGRNIYGYICHGSGQFRALSEKDQAAMGVASEPNRVGLTATGFAGNKVTLPNGQLATVSYRPNSNAAYVRIGGKTVSGTIKKLADALTFVPTPGGANAALVGA
jgi:hypothetical protein